MKIGILWDLDGTLLNTLEDLKDAVNYAMTVHGCPVRTLEQVRQDVGNGAARLIHLSLRDLPAPPPEDAVLQTFKTYYDSHCQIKTAPYPGIREILEQISQKYPVAVVSNKPDSAVKILCSDYFGSVYARGDRPGCRRKPAPDVIFQTMADIGVDTCIYVGDSEVDVATARNAGVPCLSVLWGFRDRETLIQSGASHFCTDPKELEETLCTMAREITR